MRLCPGERASGLAPLRPYPDAEVFALTGQSAEDGGQLTVPPLHGRRAGNPSPYRPVWDPRIPVFIADIVNAGVVPGQGEGHLVDVVDPSLPGLESGDGWNAHVERGNPQQGLETVGPVVRYRPQPDPVERIFGEVQGVRSSIGATAGDVCPGIIDREAKPSPTLDPVLVFGNGGDAGVVPAHPDAIVAEGDVDAGYRLRLAADQLQRGIGDGAAPLVEPRGHAHVHPTLGRRDELITAIAAVNLQLRCILAIVGHGEVRAGPVPRHGELVFSLASSVGLAGGGAGSPSVVRLGRRRGIRPGPPPAQRVGGRAWHRVPRRGDGPGQGLAFVVHGRLQVQLDRRHHVHCPAGLRPAAGVVAPLQPHFPLPLPR